MFNKRIIQIIFIAGLAACASGTPPHSTTPPSPKLHSNSTNPATLLVGQWHCQAKFEENIDYKFNVDYQANGTNRNQGILTVKLDSHQPDLLWQFEVQTQNTWHIKNGYYVEQERAKPTVKLLPISNPATQLRLQLFEKNKPEILQMKNDIFNGLNTFDNEIFQSKIIILNHTTFQTEMESEDGSIFKTCRRR